MRVKRDEVVVARVRKSRIEEIVDFKVVANKY